MIEYLIKSALCLAILLAVYHLSLEKEKTHHFNRFYLLLSLGFGLLIPLISLGLPVNPFQIFELIEVQNGIFQPFNLPAGRMLANVNPDEGPAFNYLLFAIAVYGIVAGLLLLKFVYNLFKLRLRISKNAKVEVSQVTIVLLDENVIPHSFLRYTFLTKQDYINGHIEQDIITHEFTHVHQQHTLDLLFIELLKVVFWFNPVFIFYKKAIQLNHEFLADEAVITANSDLSAYQHLLLQTASLKTVGLASNFNYSITKKRLQKMKKHTSKTRKMVMGLSLIPVATALVFMFSDQVFAQGTSATTEVKINLSSQSSMSKDEYYKGSVIRFINEKNENIKEQQKYESLSETDKKNLPSPVSPTSELINTWKDSKKYKVMVNFEAPLNNLNNLKPKDYVSYQTYKSPQGNITNIFLLTRDFLENIKKLGGSFNWVNNGVAVLAPPPPVIMPAKN